MRTRLQAYLTPDDRLLTTGSPGALRTSRSPATVSDTPFKRPPRECRYMDRDSAPQEITRLVGREVYSNNGVFLGEVEDLRLDLDTEEVTGLALHELNRELFDSEALTARGVIIPYRWVQSVGDIIIVNDLVERIQDAKGGDEEAAAA
jgi:sporulation protein YlmC with PRC-barrel domain